MGKKYSIYLIMLLGLVMSIVTLATDLTVSKDYDIYLLYLIPLLLVFKSYLSKRYILSITAVNTIFILLKFIIPPFETPGASTFNRLYFVPIMWIIAYIQVQRKKAYSEINKSQRQLQIRADSMPQMVWTAGPDGSVDYINKKWSEFTHLEEKDVIGSGWLNILHPEDVQRTMDKWTHSIKTGEIFEVSNRFRRFDGQYYWYLNRAVPQKDNQGNIIKWYGTSTDISEVKRLEQEISVLAQRFKRITESNIVGILISDVKGYMAEANDYYLNLIGYTREDVKNLQLRWQDITPSEYLPLDYHAKEELKETGISSPYEKEYVTKSGERKWILIANATLPGKEQQFLSFVQDISRRKYTEQVLSNNQFVLSEAQRIAHIGSYTFDYGTNIAEWSDEMYRIFGKDPASWALTPENVMNCVHPDDRDLVLKAIKAVNEEHQPYDTEYRILLDDQTVKYLYTKRGLLRDSSGKIVGVIGTAMDMTERKLQEQRLKETLANLERSNKELEQFAFVASHDLQEPLRMIFSYIKLVFKRSKEITDPKIMEFLKFIADSAKRMQELINDLLSYSRITTKAKPFETVDLEEVLEEVKENLKLTIKERQAKIIHEKLPVVFGDHIQFMQLFQNLISNAIKFRSAFAPIIQIGARQQGNEWIFTVQDNGIGIDPRFHDRIFMIFQRLHERHLFPGTGIGLAICQKIVERHNGRIWVESEFGKGSTFYFTIPSDFQKSIR